MDATFEDFERLLTERFGGVLSAGTHHVADGAASALECAHAAVGDQWNAESDRWPNIRVVSTDEGRRTKPLSIQVLAERPKTMTFLVGN